MIFTGQLVPTRDVTRGKDSSLASTCLGHLLLVDDDRTGLYLRGHILEQAGYTVTLRSDPKQALQCDMNSFDLAIVDFDMPGCDGRELLLRMRALKARFPILLLSGSVDTLPWETRVLFARCIAKPTCNQALLAAVTAFLEQSVLPDCC
jgi:CheY-like chemotaxis protein